MKGTSFVRGLPERGSRQERDDRIVDAVRRGMHAPLNWSPLQVRARGIDATLFVMADALMIGEPGDFVRVSVNADTAQRVAWELGAYLPTTKICDEVWEQAKCRIKPQTQGPPDYDYFDMDAPERMIDYHEQVDTAIGMYHGGSNIQMGALVGNVGKHWVLSNKLLGTSKVCNYGWYVERGWHVSASGKRMIQTLGRAHNGRHVDYSQMLRLVKNEVIVNGQSLLFSEVATDEELCWLLSDEGVLKTFSIPSAQPWAPEDGQVYEEPTSATPPNIPAGRPESEPIRRLVYYRLLYRGCAPADDVGEWQSFLQVKSDNKFGPITEGATRQFQRASLFQGKRLVVDGIAGRQTIGSANDQIDELEATREDIAEHVPTLDLSRIRFQRAKNYTWADRKPGDVKWIVIHTMESSETPTTAEAVASWFAGSNAPRASAHFNVDCDSIVQSVKTADVGWHAPGANRSGIGIEHAGRAKQTPADWADEYTTSMLETQSVPLCGYLCAAWGIPVEFVDAEGLRAGKPGITTHYEVSKAFKKSDHWDPGHNFPMERYLQKVRDVVGSR